MSLPSRAATYRYFRQVQVRSGDGGQSGYFRGYAAYFDNAQWTVLLRHCRNPRLRRPFPVVMFDPPTIEVDNPQDYDGFVPITPMAA
jgi:hypothetical protein